MALYAASTSIRKEAAQLDPLKVLITLLLVVPFALGWSVRLIWVVIALMWTGGVHGWRTASGQIAARSGGD